ncbi:MAG: phage neck terminator protein [Cetobacterium sp.]
MLFQIIKNLINSRDDKPCQVIEGYSGKKEPTKPYGVAYEISETTEDVFWDDESLKEKEHAFLQGESTIQFEVIADTLKEAKEKVIILKNLIIYNMRYQEWEQNGIGIINDNIIIKPMHEEQSKQWIYRYIFDVKFEYNLEVDRYLDLAKIIEVTANEYTATVTKKED